MDPVRTRAKILKSADALFGERGFDVTTTRDIAERADVNRALVHYHFGTKDELLDAVLEGYYARLGETLAAALTRRSGLQAQVEDLVDAYADFLAAHGSFTRIVQREVATGRHVDKIVQRTLPMFQLGVTWLDRSLPRTPDDLDAINLLTTVYGMVVTWFTYGEVLRKLTGTDPFSPVALAARKRHVRKVVALLLAEVEPCTPTTRR